MIDNLDDQPAMSDKRAGKYITPNQKAAVERVIEAMTNDLGRMWTINSLARVGQYSKSYFMRVFKAVTGLTPGLYLARLREQAQLAELPLSEGNVTSGNSVRQPITSIIAHAAGARHTKAVQRVIAVIEVSLERDWTQDELARVANYSTWHFSRIFRQKTGTTLMQYLSRLRFEKAAELLRTTTLPILDIPHRVGYVSSGSFSVGFHQRFGMSPTDYRKSAPTKPHKKQK